MSDNLYEAQRAEQVEELPKFCLLCGNPLHYDIFTVLAGRGPSEEFFAECHICDRVLRLVLVVYRTVGDKLPVTPDQRAMLEEQRAPKGAVITELGRRKQDAERTD